MNADFSRVEVISSEEITKAMSEFGRLLENLKTGRISLKEVYSEKNRLFSHIFSCSLTSDNIGGLRELIDGISNKFRIHYSEQKITSALQHENAHASAAKLWAQNHGLQLDVKYGVCVTCDDLFEGVNINAFTDFPNIESVITSATQYVSLYEHITNNSELSKIDLELYKNLLPLKY